MAEVTVNLQAIEQNMKAACERSGRSFEDITLIGVTKYVTIERTIEVIRAGVRNLGENRHEGFLEKYEAIGDKANWHFIGSLQTRKVKEIIKNVDVIHSLDRKSLAKEINKRSTDPVDCFVQVNVSGEASKHGLAPDELHAFIDMLKDYPNVHVVGLMTMAPHIKDKEEIRQVFRHLKQLRDEVRDRSLEHAPCEALSMGMSNDYDIAIEEGATHIRIGSSLVGNGST